MHRHYWVAVMLFLSISVSAQINVKTQSQTIRQTLKLVEGQSDYTFFYNEGLADLEKTISLDLQETSIENILKKLFSNTNIAYKMEGKTIVLTVKEKIREEEQAQQTQRLSGNVKDENGEPVIGANIFLKGTSTGTVTDVNGNFDLNIPNSAASKAELVVSYVGYLTQTVQVKDKSQVTVTLTEDTQLDEVVVVGYGTQKKRDLTGAVSSIKITDEPVGTYSTISHALAGKAAGFQVTQNTAQVGGGATFRIRGATSTGAGNDPLIIVDGFPVSRSTNLASGNRYDAGYMDNFLENINPNDIESIEVLKDASATAIYGSRAGHGVIIVTTKRGKNQKATVTYSGNASVQNMTNSYQMLDAQEFMTQTNKNTYENYLKNNGLDVYKDYIELKPGHVVPAYVPNYTDQDIANAKNTDWFDAVTRKGFQQSHNISLSGGTESTKYMTSVNYFKQEGVIRNNNMDRFTAKLNLDQQVSRYVKAGLSFNLNRNQYDNVPLGSGQSENAGLISAAVRFYPTIPIYDENGKYSINPEASFLPNPVSLLEITDKTIKDRMLGSAYVEAEPIKGLLLKAVLGVDRRDTKRKNYLPKTTMYGAGVNGQADISQRDDTDYLMDITATYSKVINNHSFTALAGYSYQQFNWEGFNAGNNDFILDVFLYNNLGAGAYAKPRVGSYGGKSSLGSYFGRLNYSFMGKYLLTATLRADGASNFDPDYRWGYFPSASLGWRFSDEAFMSSLSSVLSNGKLRAGYGQTGNSNVGDRINDTYYATSSWGSLFGNSYSIGARANQLGNPRLKWETTTELNIGLDLGFFNNRISTSLEYYDRTISDLLVLSKTLLSYNEITTIAANIGKTQGKGFELTLNTVNITNKDFSWSTDLTYSRFRDRWKERDPEWKPNTYESVNDPIRSAFSYLSDGLLQPGEKAPDHQKSLLPGQIKLKDLSGEEGKPDGLLNSYDMVYLGTSDPDFIFGFNNTLKYKNFDFNIYFYGQINQLRGASYYENYGIGDARPLLQGFNISTMGLETWSHDYQNAKYPNQILSGFSTGDYYNKKISYVRCRNITAGYVIPVSKNIADKVRVYADVNNPFIITNWTGIDPETEGNQYSYPNVTSFSLGIDITF
jgi:TonB-linked SusC/RagA family outer membrane protein